MQIIETVKGFVDHIIHPSRGKEHPLKHEFKLSRSQSNEWGEDFASLHTTDTWSLDGPDGSVILTVRPAADGTLHQYVDLLKDDPWSPDSQPDQIREGYVKTIEVHPEHVFSFNYPESVYRYLMSFYTAHFQSATVEPVKAA